MTPVCTSILNTAENYNLFLPSSEDNYGCQNDTVTRTATFFTYTQIGFNGNYLGREDKFSIRVYTEEDWAEKEQDDEDILLSSSARARVCAAHFGRFHGGKRRKNAAKRI